MKEEVWCGTRRFEGIPGIYVRRQLQVSRWVAVKLALFPRELELK